MRVVDIISKKRDGGTLTEDEIRFFVNGFVKGTIPDYQASALCMAILLKGMSKKETIILTDAMVHSGETIDLSDIKGIKADKHSTGGVGDKVSLALGPLVAACGVKFAKMSGRGLSHTGGTLDKLESVPGMKVALSEKDFKDQVNKIGIAIISQTVEVDPADKKLYPLRDVTGTVPSIPLIASSIMSKKLASGSDTILLDVKFGSGAFMKTFDKAQELANIMVEIGKSLGRDTRAIISDMDQPLGCAVGNSLEVKEAIATLQGKGPKDFTEIVVEAGAIVLIQANLATTLEEGENKIIEAIRNRSGYQKLIELFKAQGGDYTYIENPEKFPIAKNVIKILAPKSGYVSGIHSEEIGLAAMKLGAGRAKLGDTIDMSAGIVLAKKVGDEVQEGDLIATAYTNKDDVYEIIQEIKDAYKITNSKKIATSLIRAYIR